MIGKIIGFISCALCAVPFFMIAVSHKDSKEPIPFWSGDTNLKEKIQNVNDYNREMALVYKKYAIAFLIAGIGFMVTPIAGSILLCIDCTLGIYLIYKKYKRLSDVYSHAPSAESSSQQSQ